MRLTISRRSLGRRAILPTRARLFGRIGASAANAGGTSGTAAAAAAAGTRAESPGAGCRWRIDGFGSAKAGAGWVSRLGMVFMVLVLVQGDNKKIYLPWPSVAFRSLPQASG